MSAICDFGVPDALADHDVAHGEWYGRVLDLPYQGPPLYEPRRAADHKL